MPIQFIRPYYPVISQPVVYYPNVGDTSPLFITYYNTTDYTGVSGWNQRIDGSYHSLFPMTFAASAGIYYNNLSLGSSFTMTFDWYYGKRSCCFAADGLSFLLYADSSMLDPTTGISTTGWWGRSYGGYLVYLQRYAYQNNQFVQVYYNDALLYTSGTFIEPGYDQFFPVSLTFNSGVITLTLNGVTIGSYTHNVVHNYTKSYFAIIGRSGGDTSEQRIRNLIITPI